ncbi:DUF5605 domain-containing protein [Kineococcus sp. SYSU DK003]|uniref:DUF5605 domain-containing protein n=1 Tax=Kineococcus sp. SYSU DK003 TaxID=3383124 RepID=UPI003D7E3566
MVGQGRSAAGEQRSSHRLPGAGRGRLTQRRARADRLRLRPSLGRRRGRVPGQLPRERADAGTARTASARHLARAGPDTWNCTVEELPGQYELAVHLPLSSEPYQAVRLIKA